ncbi:MAG: hypothetical protein PSX37_05115, partial [bacterium]|nr:hypothetical protein [bacterium]
LGNFNLPTGLGELTTIGAPASFASSPAVSGLCPGNALTLTVVGAPAAATYQWQYRPVAGAWTDLTNGAHDLRSSVAGATTPVLSLTTLTVLDAGSYRCAITSACGTDFTNPSALTLCEGDSDCDADTDSDDIVTFFGFWDAGDSKADADGDGDTDSDDIVTFFGSWDGGC